MEGELEGGVMTEGKGRQKRASELSVVVGLT